MTEGNPKIIDLLKEEMSQPYVSLEYFPPRTEDGVKVSFLKVERKRKAIFCSHDY